jgi:hypothetical protein
VRDIEEKGVFSPEMLERWSRTRVSDVEVKPGLGKLINQADKELARDWCIARDLEYINMIRPHELAPFCKGKTFELVPQEPGRHLYRIVDVRKAKSDQNGYVSKLKVRATLDGSAMVSGRDYNRLERYAGTPRFETLTMLLALAARFDWDIWQADVKQAYLLGELPKQAHIYCRINPHLIKSKNNEYGWLPRGHCLKLVGSIYGHVTAGWIWQQMLIRVLTRIGYSQTHSDPCLFTKTILVGGRHTSGRGRHGKGAPRIIAIYFYVDDLCLFMPKKLAWECFEALEREGIPLDGKEECEWFLNMKITRTRSTRQVSLALTTLIEKAKYEFEPSELRTRAPMDATKQLRRRTPEDTRVMDSPYRSLVGTLLYVSRVRYDIAYTVCKLSRYLDPGRTTPDHWDAAMRCLRYICQTVDRQLVLGGEKFELVCFCDSDFASDPDNRRSTQGATYFLGGMGAFMARCNLQKCVTLSSCEAEYMALAAACRTIIWIRRLLAEMGYEQKDPTPLYCDSDSAIKLTEAQGFHERTKHVDIKYHFSRMCRNEGTVDFRAVDTSENRSDGLTKALRTIIKHQQMAQYMLSERGNLPVTSELTLDETWGRTPKSSASPPGGGS